jgi:hypothetical protein
VIVAVPNDRHREIVAAALESGLHDWPVDTSGLSAGGWDHPGEVEQLEAFVTEEWRVR